MMRPARLVMMTVAVLCAAPAFAVATSESAVTAPAWLGFGMGGFALVVSALLLVEVAALRRLAEGSAFSDNMAYVMAGIVALAASALAGWVALLDPVGLGGDLVSIVSDALVGVGMVLLGVYFFRVRRAMKRYLSVLSSVEPLASVQSDATAREEPPGV